MPTLLARLDPLRGIEKRREVLAWGMYDLANQSFTLLINTLLFAVFLKHVVIADHRIAQQESVSGVDARLIVAVKQNTALSPTDVEPEIASAVAQAFPAESLVSVIDRVRAVVEPALRSGDRWWAVMSASSLLVVVLLSPLLGALADARQLRKELLIGTGLLCAILTCCLGLIGPGTLLLAALLYIPANIAFQLGENFLASFLPDVSTPRTIGRVSATGWTMGYAGAVILLLCVVGGMFLLGLGPTERWRPFFVFAGLWFLGGMIPAMVVLRESKRSRGGGANIVVECFGRLARTARQIGRFRDLSLFFLAFLVYSLGVQTVVMFAAVIAVDFGLGSTDLGLFALQLAVTAGIAAIATAQFQDRIGAHATVVIYLIVWVATAAALLWMTTLAHKPAWLFWVVGNGIGLGLGGIGTASRALVGRFTPRQRSAEFFGMWGMVYKLAGVPGILSFGLVKAGGGMTPAMALLLAFFVVGLVMVMLVREKRGLLAAARAQRDDALSPTGSAGR